MIQIKLKKKQYNSKNDESERALYQIESSPFIN